MISSNACKVRIGGAFCDEVCDPCSASDVGVDICGAGSCTQSLFNYNSYGDYSCYLQSYIFSR
ncbi:MAG: hypothetical protein HYZ54_01315 [Ignavibacteriae bacterium]|nr:hypothetical protein [Ignavibacteriota bacterium]